LGLNRDIRRTLLNDEPTERTPPHPRAPESHRLCVSSSVTNKVDHRRRASFALAWHDDVPHLPELSRGTDPKGLLPARHVSRLQLEVERQNLEFRRLLPQSCHGGHPHTSQLPTVVTTWEQPRARRFM
jgi:hypothetical protein